MTSYKFLVCATLFIFSTVVSAADGRWAPDLRHLDAIPMHSLPVLNMQKAVTTAKSKNNPLQFAVTASLPLTLDDGAWEQLNDGSWSWRTRIYSVGAQTLNLHFSQFSLPEGASLMLYDPSGSAIAGPYTKADQTTDGQLWTSVVNGETVIAEVRTPASMKDQVQLQIGEVNHGYRSLAKSGVGQFGDSGSCEINVACPAGDPYRSNQARALALITINGRYLCSGQLINNVRRDNTPYFLTAYHCGITSSTAGSVVFYWNYQSSACTPSDEPSSNQTQSGSTFVAGDATSDFTLIRTAHQPKSSYNLYLAGWNAGSTAPQSGGVIHHPEGDVTKVSIFSTPASKQDGATLCLDDVLSAVCTKSRKVNVWQVRYSQGVTEGGSSGSALYDQNGLIVGQLSGGSTSCSASSSATDIYGRLNAAWTASTSSSGQLKANLDPDDSGTLSLSGQNLGTYSDSNTTAAGSSGGGGGGAFAPLTLLGLTVFGLLRRRAISRRASSV